MKNGVQGCSICFARPSRGGDAAHTQTTAPMHASVPVQIVELFIIIVLNLVLAIACLVDSL